MWEIKSPVTGRKNAFNGLISRPDTTEERLPELKVISTEISKTEELREKKIGGKNTQQNAEHNTKDLLDNHKRCNIHIMGLPEGKERTEGILEITMIKNFTQIHVRHQTTDPERSENTKQDNQNHFKC